MKELSRAQLIAAAKKAKATHVIFCTDVFGGERVVHVHENFWKAEDQCRRSSHQIEVIPLLEEEVFENTMSPKKRESSSRHYKKRMI